MKRILMAFVMTAALALVAVPASAATVTVTDANTTVTVCTDDQSCTTGMNSWLVNGVEMMFQQWFWYRIGAQGPETILSGGTLSSIDSGPFNLIDYTLTAQGYTISVSFDINGGLPGSLASDVAETITISNTGSTPLDFHFFQYSDFDLCSSGDDTVTFSATEPGHRVQLSDANCVLTETVVTPSASYWEAGLFSTTRTKLNDGVSTTLNNNSSAGPGDATWAYQWDFVLNANDSFIISKDKNIRAVPEPATMLLFGLGMAGIAAAARRRVTAS
jgi:hypothetical protein